jgi:type IV pilus assembly protein PilC
MEGRSESVIRRKCESHGWRVMAIVPKTGGILSRFFISLTGNLSISFRFGVRTSELALFCEVMKALYSSGVPIPQSFQIVIEETPNLWFRKRLQIVLERLQDGDDVSTAMSDARCRRAFPPLMRETVRTGEVNGRLDRSLERLAELFQRSAETKRETISALMYPALAFIVFCVVCTVIAIMVPDALQEAVGEADLTRVMNKPKFPTVMKWLFYLRENPYYLLAVPCGMGGIAFLWWLGKKKRATRIALTRVERKIPLLGNILYFFALVRFLDLLAANNETGIQVAESLELLEGSVNDALIEESLKRMRTDILVAGAGLGQAMNANREQDVFPGLVRQMVRAGEESGRLTEMLLPIVDYYGGQARAMLKRTLDMLTPIMIILLGAIIGPILIALYKTLILLQDIYAHGG